MNKRYDLTGQTFGRLRVISEAETRNKIKYWNCVCECGNTKKARTNSLMSGITKSCGCLMNEVRKAGVTKIDIIGNRYGRLTVRSEVADRTKCGEVKYLCVCDCGNETVVSGTSLRNGSTKSCGCFLRESAAERNTTHGLSSTPLYKIWDGMKQRCHNPNNHAYEYYGARGIHVCDEWMNDAESFINWALENGWEPGLEIDRKNNEEGYNPENCRCVTHKVNMNNTRRSVEKRKAK